MLAGKVGSGGPLVRLCVCCGTPAATPSIPACWDHWIALPEDLRSTMIKTSARGQLAQYGEALLVAIKLWRREGLWRSKFVKRAPLSAPASKAPILGIRTLGEVVQLAERRRKAIRQAERVRSGYAAVQLALLPFASFGARRRYGGR